MKRKLIKRNKAFLSKCIKDAKGWPLYLFLYDRYSKMSVIETRYYKKLRKESYTKQGRINGLYLMWYGKEPSRICVGLKGKNNILTA